MPERQLQLATLEDMIEPLHIFTVEPPLSAGEIDSLKNRPPYEPITAIAMFFNAETGALGGWPFDHVVSETMDSTVFALPDGIFDYVREQTPEQIARKLALTLHAQFSAD